MSCTFEDAPPGKAPRRNFRCWSRISWSRSPRGGQAKIYAPEAVELPAPPNGPATCAKLSNWCARTSRCRMGGHHSAENRAAIPGGNPTRLPSFDEARDEFTRITFRQNLSDHRRQRQSRRRSWPSATPPRPSTAASRHQCLPIFSKIAEIRFAGALFISHAVNFRDRWQRRGANCVASLSSGMWASARVSAGAGPFRLGKIPRRLFSLANTLQMRGSG